ncbi:phospholipase A2-like isoform X6 [Nerophis ophidion]|uniref:phospholipase A2-like isoform X6 n=1 Tax=Nerophis ophidion TaxID=159077 RepID=UPI002ADF7359|nr:phospholipase A2-like isoform X6 [Nerophis ophidion]
MCLPSNPNGKAKRQSVGRQAVGGWREATMSGSKQWSRIGEGEDVVRQDTIMEDTVEIGYILAGMSRQAARGGTLTNSCTRNAAVSAAGSSLERTKRGVLELGGIIKCTTQSPAFAYLWYGCYCGLGGHGNPVDETDECCHQHDCCYNRAEKEGCKPKTDRYKWTCEDNMAICDALTDQCEKILCKCDREFGDCLKNARYSRMYTVWPNFFCSDEKKSCN